MATTARLSTAAAENKALAVVKNKNFPCNTCKFNFASKELRERHRESLFHKKKLQVELSARETRRFMNEMDINGLGFPFSQMHKIMRGDYNPQRLPGGECHECKLQFFTRE